MDRKQLDVVIPVVYGLLVAVCAMWVKGALVPVAMVGGVAVGLYYAVFRSRIASSGEPPDQSRP